MAGSIEYFQYFSVDGLPNFCDEAKPERQTGFLSHVSKPPPF